ncbi:MAG TPA: molybdopterin-dependent oxidoreductase, partial [Flavisolibacter sp.]|nr:molybdopterin-dependent oxidoreductase [Flavisolibacter sp.]
MKEKIYNEHQYRTKTIFAFCFFILAFVGGIFLWIYIRKEPQNNGIPATLRNGLNTNEAIFSRLYSSQKLVKTYPKSEAVKNVRVNGNIGLRDKHVDTSNWRLHLVKNNSDTLVLSLDDIKRLPKTDVVFDFKCIEGWSQKTWWSGVRFSDFLQYYHLNDEAKMKYVGLVTPDKEYYVGVDMPSVIHPQTLLCYEMNGKSLPVDQG